MKTAFEIRDEIRAHRCYTHPIFEHWAATDPKPPVVAALFHQIRSFCDATRPGWSFPDALEELGLAKESTLLQEIVDSEENHGPELATMAGYIVNRATGSTVFADLYDQHAVEVGLKGFSDRLLGDLPGYDRESGLTAQARHARSQFDRRKLTDKESTLRNLGCALALEMISHNHLIPGEKLCLVDAGLYDVSLGDAEMHYLEEHWGEVGAERYHEENAVAAVESVLAEDAGAAALVADGARGFLDALASFWDVLDASLLQSGYVEQGVS